MILKIPSLIAWCQDDDLIAYHPPHFISSIIKSHPVRWTLKRILGKDISTSRGLFFTKPYEIDRYLHSSSKFLEKFKQSPPIPPPLKSSTTVVPPLFLWPKGIKILTNSIIEYEKKMYYLGAFGAVSHSAYEKEKKIKQIDLHWLENLFLSNMPKGTQPDRYQVEQNVDDLWQRIFTLTRQFRQTNIYWFEDNILPLEDVGIRLNESGDSKICIYRVGENLKATEKLSFEGTQSNFAGIKGLISSDSFNIFIVDIISEWLDSKGVRKITPFGAEMIRAIRGYESNNNSIKSMIIVYTGGYSPYVISRANALKADQVIFKQTGVGRQEKGLHLQGSTTEAQFLLFWSIYWPLAMLRYLNIRLKAIADIDPNTDVGKLIYLYDEISKICPEGVFYFWQDWLTEVKQVLQKWQSIMLIKGAYITHEDSKIYQKEINELISKAGFKLNAD